MNTTRLLTSIALLSLLLTPVASQAQTRRGGSASSSGGETHIAGLLGFESGFGDTAPALRLDGEWDLQPLSTGKLGLVGSAGFTFFGNDVVDVNTLKLAASLRWTLPAAPNLDVYADGGLGLYVADASVKSRFGGGSDTEVGLLMRFAGGLLFHVNDRVRLGGELGLNPYFGDIDDTTFSLMGVLSYRL